LAQRRGPARMPRRGDLASGCRRGKMERLRHVAAMVSAGEGGRRWGMKLGRPPSSTFFEGRGVAWSGRRSTTACAASPQRQEARSGMRSLWLTQLFLRDYR
jgi:hypothetical protein